MIEMRGSVITSLMLEDEQFVHTADMRKIRMTLLGGLCYGRIERGESLPIVLTLDELDAAFRP